MDLVALYAHVQLRYVGLVGSRFPHRQKKGYCQIMSSFLVTGGCGFVGSHLVEALVSSGHSVRVLDDLSTGYREHLPPNTELLVGDVTDEEAVCAALRDMDGCFHLAAVSSVDRSREEWLRTHLINLAGTVNIFDQVRKTATSCPIPVVYASSAAVYGDNPAIPLRETAQLRPMSGYAVDKLGCELNAQVASRIHGVPTTGLRFFNIYGPRQDPLSSYSGVISRFCERLSRSKRIDIHGDGGQARDFVYVRDAVSAFMAALPIASTDHEVFNVCTGHATSIATLAGLVAELYGVPLRTRSLPARPADIRISVGDPVRAAERLDFTARTPLSHGLRMTIAFLQQRSNEQSSSIRPCRLG
jgi:UDP-glucose 4-epimerase